MSVWYDLAEMPLPSTEASYFWRESLVWFSCRFVLQQTSLLLLPRSLAQQIHCHQRLLRPLRYGLDRLHKGCILVVRLNRCLKPLVVSSIQQILNSQALAGSWELNQHCSEFLHWVVRILRSNLSCYHDLHLIPAVLDCDRSDSVWHYNVYRAWVNCT